ncbi:hypothetical protein BVL52_08710 [Pseudomonas oryzihabitans]|uniref:Zinc ribbon domain-containing protein n=1 Tax=Pseudomonas oryzihabitans TaxID=47885 RepID=A0ABX3IV62_9PSED|nr:hypothetical protein BVL52_08710 [Pseudomonas psychrotolerans]
MSHVYPTPQKCPQCGFHGYARGENFCPKCMDAFLKTHVPKTVADPGAKPFDPNGDDVFSCNPISK